ncbi:hypothetical protein Q5H92_14360 [Hymenobacter sp. M29]|uniref:DUF1616 domain-containing protein n=1 Tax=Hymenobacter mellowenesis TaxID=3063995 RepID=A0ABT9ADV3_9BACT|nr:hypothetical protein [Hymenobacter sp. M29]MDO7847549.1 hypothetical protein [Hymenobacter sp. M29]
MIGVPGLGILLVLAIILLFYLPFITVKILAKLAALNSFPASVRKAVIVITFLLFAGLTLLLIRANPYNLDWLLLYAVVSTLLYFTIKWIQKSKIPAA